MMAMTAKILLEEHVETVAEDGSGHKQIGCKIQDKDI